MNDYFTVDTTPAPPVDEEDENSINLYDALDDVESQSYSEHDCSRNSNSFSTIGNNSFLPHFSKRYRRRRMSQSSFHSLESSSPSLASITSRTTDTSFTTERRMSGAAKRIRPRSNTSLHPSSVHPISEVPMGSQNANWRITEGKFSLPFESSPSSASEEGLATFDSSSPIERGIIDVANRFRRRINHMLPGSSFHSFSDMTSESPQPSRRIKEGKFSLPFESSRSEIPRGISLNYESSRPDEDADTTNTSSTLHRAIQTLRRSGLASTSCHELSPTILSQSRQTSDDECGEDSDNDLSDGDLDSRDSFADDGDNSITYQSESDEGSIDIGIPFGGVDDTPGPEARRESAFRNRVREESPSLEPGSDDDDGSIYWDVMDASISDHSESSCDLIDSPITDDELFISDSLQSQDSFHDNQQTLHHVMYENSSMGSSYTGESEDDDDDDSIYWDVVNSKNDRSQSSSRSLASSNGIDSDIMEDEFFMGSMENVYQTGLSRHQSLEFGKKKGLLRHSAEFDHSCSSILGKSHNLDTSMKRVRFFDEAEESLKLGESSTVLQGFNDYAIGLNDTPKSLKKRKPTNANAMDMFHELPGSGPLDINKSGTRGDSDESSIDSSEHSLELEDAAENRKYTDMLYSLGGSALIGAIGAGAAKLFSKIRDAGDAELGPDQLYEMMMEDSIHASEVAIESWGYGSASSLNASASSFNLSGLNLSASNSLGASASNALNASTSSALNASTSSLQVSGLSFQASGASALNASSSGLSFQASGASALNASTSSLQASGLTFQASGLSCQASGLSCQASAASLQASGASLQASGLTFQASGASLQASGASLQASGASLQASSSATAFQASSSAASSSLSASASASTSAASSASASATATSASASAAASSASATATAASTAAATTTAAVTGNAATICTTQCVAESMAVSAASTVGTASANVVGATTVAVTGTAAATTASTSTTIAVSTAVMGAVALSAGATADTSMVGSIINSTAHMCPEFPVDTQARIKLSFARDSDSLATDLIEGNGDWAELGSEIMQMYNNISEGCHETHQRRMLNCSYQFSEYNNDDDTIDTYWTPFVTCNGLCPIEDPLFGIDTPAFEVRMLQDFYPSNDMIISNHTTPSNSSSEPSDNSRFGNSTATPSPSMSPTSSLQPTEFPSNAPSVRPKVPISRLEFIQSVRASSVEPLTQTDFESKAESFLNLPSEIPSVSPSASPSASTSLSPSDTPTFLPSNSPSASPTDDPSSSPSSFPSPGPSHMPTSRPSHNPSGSPSDAPSSNPSSFPSPSPSDTPTFLPSNSPSASYTDDPSSSPSFSPSPGPSHMPTFRPSHNPSGSSSDAPSSNPSSFPSRSPSDTPTFLPSNSPSASHTPSAPLSSAPSTSPSSLPSPSPSHIGQKILRPTQLTV